MKKKFRQNVHWYYMDCSYVVKTDYFNDNREYLGIDDVAYKWKPSLGRKVNCYDIHRKIKWEFIVTSS